MTLTRIYIATCRCGHMPLNTNPSDEVKHLPECGTGLVCGEEGR